MFKVKTLFTVICLLFSTLSIVNAQTEVRSLESFSKIIVSPLIDVVLIKGEKESVEIVAENVALNKINTKTTGRTLKVFLDKARTGTNSEKLIDPNDPDVLIRRSKYYDAKVKIYITYNHLRRLEMRGEGSLVCQDRLAEEKVKLKLMGEIDAEIAEIDTKKFVLSSMGENEIFIANGAANKQVYRIFGESMVNTFDVVSEVAKISVFGSGEVRLSTDDNLKLKTFGESKIYYAGSPQVTKSLILGDATIRAL